MFYLKLGSVLCCLGVVLVLILVPVVADAKRPESAPVTAIDLYTEMDQISVNVVNYFKGVSNAVFGIKTRTYANDSNADVYSGYFAASSDSSVRNSYGVFGMSKPDWAVEKSVGVHGEGFSGNLSIGVEGSGGDIGVLGEAPFGGVALKAKQHESNGYALYAEGGKNYLEGNLTIGTATKPQGVTLYDYESGAPVCLQVASGVVQLEQGTCN